MSPETMLQVGLQEASANGGVCLEVSANVQGLLMCGKLLKKFGPSNQAWSASAHTNFLQPPSPLKQFQIMA
jgi:hypothetical protein